MSESVDGGYRLYGVAGETSVLATKDGYQSQEQRLLVRDHETLNLEVTPVRVDDVSGTYTMTITAAESCRARLPAEARVRTYTAVLTQSGQKVVATLTGGRFVIDGTGHGNRFHGWLDSGRLFIDLQPYDVYYFTFVDSRHADVIEEIAGGYLVVVGFSRLSFSPRRLVGRMSGEMDFYSTVPPGPPSVRCLDFAAGHEIVLAR